MAKHPPPKLAVANAAQWRQWLARHVSTSDGVFLTVVKKGQQTSTTSLTYEQALDEALCHGWIDSGGSGSGKLDEVSYRYRFTPRRPNSAWSKRNVGYAERLEREGRMQPSGRAAIAAAKADGRWDGAYSGSATDEAVAQGIPDFLPAVKRVPAAQKAWDSLSKGNRWHIYFTLINLKTAAARERRIEGFVGMLAQGETPLSAPKKQPETSKRSVPSSSGSDSGEPAQEIMTANANPKRARKSSEPKATSNGQANGVRQTRSGRSAPSYKE